MQTKTEKLYLEAKKYWTEIFNDANKSNWNEDGKYKQTFIHCTYKRIYGTM